MLRRIIKKHRYKRQVRKGFGKSGKVIKKIEEKDNGWKEKEINKMY